MRTRTVSFKNADGVREKKVVVLSPAQEAERDADEVNNEQRRQAKVAARQAEQARLASALSDIDPAQVNSIPALRDKVQAIVEVLRERFGIQV